MYFKRQETRSDGQMSVAEDLDEFDRILVQIAMFRMMGNEEELLNQEQIAATFKRRATRKEFAANSYIAYLQYGICNKDAPIINDLVSYGFRSIYHKLAWFERIHTLDIA